MYNKIYTTKHIYIDISIDIAVGANTFCHISLNCTKKPCVLKRMAFYVVTICR